MEFVRLTREMIEAGRTASGGWNYEQLALLSIPTPPKKGWIEIATGRLISERDYNLFLSLRSIKKRGDRAKIISEHNTAQIDLF